MLSLAETSTKTTEKKISLGLPALKERCRDLGLKVSGTKAELQERLANAPASRPRLGSGLRSSSDVPSLGFPALKERQDKAEAQCRYAAAAAKYDAAAAEYKAKIGTAEARAFKELKDEAYANLQSANEYLALTFRNIPDPVMNSSRKRESEEDPERCVVFSLAFRNPAHAFASSPTLRFLARGFRARRP